MFEWPSPTLSTEISPEPIPCSSRNASTGRRTMSGASSSSAASCGVSTTSGEGIARES